MPSVDPIATQPTADELLDEHSFAAALAELEKSPRVRLETIGHSHQGRPVTMIIVALPAVLADIDQHRLAALDPAQAATTVPSALFAGDSWGHEASQVEGLLKAAHTLAFDDSAEVLSALSHSIALMVPLMNPDGREAALREWRSTPLSNGDSGAGNLYGFLLNRDFVHGTQPEGRAIIETVMRYRPVTVIDLHEDMFNLGVRLPEVAFVEPFAPGADFEEDPLTRAAIVELGRAIAQRWRAQGFEAIYDEAGDNAFAPMSEPGKGLNPMAGSMGRLNLLSTLHGIPSFITESARSPGAQAWEDRVEQKASAVLATLLEISSRPQHYLCAVHERRRADRRNAGERFVVIPDADQPLDGLQTLLDLLQLHRVTFHRVQTPYAAVVVPLDQPESRIARHLLLGERSPLNELPPAHGVRVITSDSLSNEEASHFREASPQAAVVSADAAPEAPAYMARPTPRSTALVNRLLTSGAARVTPQNGSYHLEGSSTAIRWEASKLGVPLEASTPAPAAETQLSLPRVAVYAGQGVPLGESGEITWALDHGGFPYRLLDARDFGRDDVFAGVEVLVVPNGAASEIVDGWNPQASNRKAPWQLAEPVLGLGDAGLESIRRFVRGGGVYVGLGAGGAALAGDDYLGIAHVDFVPAAVGLGQVRLNVIDAGSPLVFGYDTDAPLPAFIYAPPGANNAGYAMQAGQGAVAAYAGIRGSNEDQTFITTEPLAAAAGNDAIVHQRLGDGHVVLFGIAPAFRAQWRSTFGLLYNALYLRDSR